VPARDHYAHAASLLTGIIGRSDNGAAGRAAIAKGLMARQAEQTTAAVIAA